MDKKKKKYFTKENGKAMQRCSILLAMKEAQIMTTLRQYHLPNRPAKVNDNNSKCWQRYRKTGLLIPGGKFTILQPSGKQFDS